MGGGTEGDEGGKRGVIGKADAEVNAWLSEKVDGLIELQRDPRQPPPAVRAPTPGLYLARFAAGQAALLLRRWQTGHGARASAFAGVLGALQEEVGRMNRHYAALQRRFFKGLHSQPQLDSSSPASLPEGRALQLLQGVADEHAALASEGANRDKDRVKDGIETGGGKSALVQEHVAGLSERVDAAADALWDDADSLRRKVEMGLLKAVGEDSWAHTHSYALATLYAAVAEQEVGRYRLHIATARAYARAAAFPNEEVPEDLISAAPPPLLPLRDSLIRAMRPEDVQPLPRDPSQLLREACRWAFTHKIEPEEAREQWRLRLPSTTAAAAAAGSDDQSSLNIVLSGLTAGGDRANLGAGGLEEARGKDVEAAKEEGEGGGEANAAVRRAEPQAAAEETKREAQRVKASLFLFLSPFFFWLLVCFFHTASV